MKNVCDNPVVFIPDGDRIFFRKERQDNPRLYPFIDALSVCKAVGNLDEFGQAEFFNCYFHSIWFNSYYHFLEVILAFYAFWQEFNPQGKPNLLNWGTLADYEYESKMQNNLIKAVFEDGKLDRSQSPSQMPFVYLERHPDPQFDKNNLLLALRPLVAKHIDSFKQKVWQHFVTQQNKDAIRSKMATIVYATRDTLIRGFTPQVEKEILEIAAKYGKVQIVNFGKLSIGEQVHIAYNADVLIGGQGSNMVNALWMQRGSNVIEFWLPGTFIADNLAVCEASGVRFFGVRDNQVFSNFSYQDGHRGNNNGKFFYINKSVLHKCFETVFCG